MVEADVAMLRQRANRISLRKALAKCAPLALSGGARRGGARRELFPWGKAGLLHLSSPNRAARGSFWPVCQPALGRRSLNAYWELRRCRRRCRCGMACDSLDAVCISDCQLGKREVEQVRRALRVLKVVCWRALLLPHASAKGLHPAALALPPRQPR